MVAMRNVTLAMAGVHGDLSVGSGGSAGTGAYSASLGPPRGPLVVCRACSTAWGCKSPTQPDGGEVLAKRKGVVARRRLKAAWSQTAT